MSKKNKRQRGAPNLNVIIPKSLGAKIKEIAEENQRPVKAQVEYDLKRKIKEIFRTSPVEKSDTESIVLFLYLPPESYENLKLIATKDRRSARAQMAQLIEEVYTN